MNSPAKVARTIINAVHVQELLSKGRPIFTAVYLLAGTVLVTWIDYVSGAEWSIFMLYAAPIILASWWRDLRTGLLLAALSSIAWWWANSDASLYQTTAGYFVAALSRSSYFFLSAVAASAILRQQQGQIQLLEERAKLESYIVSVSEHEQQRIGQDLHDGLCQQLAAIGCAARALADELRLSEQPTAADAEYIECAISDAISHARGLARGVFLVHVDENGLATALKELVTVTQRLTGVSITLTEIDEITVLEPEVAMHLYRITQEALANAIRHSDASQVTIRASQSQTLLRIEVTDNGKGVPSVRQSDGMGLRTMQYRAHTIGAKLTVRSAAQEGTTVCCELSIPSSFPVL
jgi:signal transduction histidine kinase